MATIICPGPSLAVTWLPHASPQRGSPIIAVNRANVLGADWYVGGDQNTFEHWPCRPRVGLCAPEPLARRMLAGDYGAAAAAAFAGVELVAWEALRLINDTVECNYSVVAACALALHLGFTTAHVYGADMAGTLDWDGATSDSARTERRWAAEAADLRRLAARFAARGGAILRHLPDAVHPITP